MRKIIALVFAAMLMAPGVGMSQSSPGSVDARKVLILAPQGVDPAKDTVGFNALVKNVTQAFAGELSLELSSKGFQTVNVLDQKPGLDAGQKMAVHAVENLAAKVAISTVETKVVGDDSQIQLRVQFIQGELTPSEAAPKGLRASKTVEKSYVLRGSKSGDTTLTMADMASDFANFVQASLE